MRESLSTARQAKSLEWQEHERAVDKIAASGLSDGLGSLLTRLADNGDMLCYAPAVKLLTKQAKASRNMAYALATQALSEWLNWQCVTCTGRGHIRLENNVSLTCPDCIGVKIRRYTDDERAAGLGVTLEMYRKKWVGELNNMRACIDTPVYRYIHELRYRLRD